MLVGIIATYVLATPVEATRVVKDTPVHIPGKATVKKMAKLPREPKIALAKTFKQSSKPVASSGGDIELIVRQAARKYGIDENHFVKIARCESTLNPNAVNLNYAENGHPSGLFQHLSGYWPARAAKYGHAGASVFNPVANAEVTAQMFRDGHSNLWECH